MRILISTLFSNKVFSLLVLLVACDAQAAFKEKKQNGDLDLAAKARMELGGESSVAQEEKPLELVSTKIEREDLFDFGPERQLYLGAFPATLSGSGVVSSNEKFSYDRLNNRPALSLRGGYWFSRVNNGRLGIFGNFSFASYGFQLSASGRTNSGEMRVNATSLSVGPVWENYFAPRFSVVLSAQLGQLFVSQLGKTDALSNSESITYAGAMVSPQWHLNKRWQFGPFLQMNREISYKDDLQVQRILYGVELGHRF